MQEDGSIKTSYTPNVEYTNIEIQSTASDHNSQTLLSTIQEPWLGKPDRSTPDVGLYLSLGSPFHHGEPEICLTGWVNGSLVGAVSILDAIKVSIWSQEEPAECPGHKHPVSVLNMRASRWVQDPYRKPTNPKHPVIVSVRGDHCWALFLAAQGATTADGRIVSHCVDCTLDVIDKQRTAEERCPGRIFAGFFPNEDAQASHKVPGHSMAN